ncbi:hypothetical protein MYX82_12775 [Acidobacteria bacterium AH-259-D05]|nr:hypothetical protein [Acidobacteria bacterium AH-259-D05]
MTGDPLQQNILEQYHSVRNAVGFLDLCGRGKIEVTGPDRVTFLHSMTSNDVVELPEWEGRYGTFLTARGKIVSDFFYYKFPEAIIIDVAADLLTVTLQTFEKYMVMDEVYLKDISGATAHVSVQGPAASSLVEELFSDSAPSKQYAVREVSWQNESLWLIRKEELAESGFEMISPQAVANSLRSAILEKGSRLGMLEISQEARNILRMEAGIPWYGVDMDENRYPMEARLEEAISLTKGCYIGQEVVAKATHIGGVSNLLMGLKIQESYLPSKDSRVLNTEGTQIGTITSAVFSPRCECPIAFAYLKRAFAQPGQICQVETAEGETAAAEVVERFV